MPLYAGDIRVAVRRASGALAFPDHGSQALHRCMVGIVERVVTVGQQFDGLANTPWLVDGTPVSYTHLTLPTSDLV